MFKIFPCVPRNPMRRYYMMHSTKTKDRSWIRILLFLIYSDRKSASFNNALSIEINEHVMNESRPRLRIPHPLLPFFTSHRKYD